MYVCRTLLPFKCYEGGKSLCLNVLIGVHGNPAIAEGLSVALLRPSLDRSILWPYKEGAHMCHMKGVGDIQTTFFSFLFQLLLFWKKLK